MVTAIIMVNVRRDAVNETAQKILEMEGVSEVYSVGGEWDLVVMVRAKSNEQLADVVTSRMLKLDAITKTTTMIAFRTYSQYDLERMFSM
ncbi:MAG: Lrp/AsnC family transcriptional regulator [Phycisphaerae bacterium]|nr:Lrp/AsnC family transcriptional regulator [Phycisphaerae bacterium]